MTSFIDNKVDQSLLSLITPTVPPFRNSDKRSMDPVIALSRGRAERKSIAADRRTKQEIGNDSLLPIRPQKSQSASDLSSLRIRTSASLSSANGTPSSANTTGRRLSIVDPLSEKQQSDGATVLTTAKQQEPQQAHSRQQNRLNKGDHASATTLATVSSLPHSQDATMNVSDASAEIDPGKLAHRERRFQRLFRNVPTSEVLLCRYSCAYVSDLGLLLQGHLYVSNNWICFHSNVFGIEKIIEIPAEAVVAVSKAHTAKIIPNAVKIKLTGKYYLFGSLISRDNTYRLLVNVTSKGRQRVENSGANKHDFTGGPYGNVSKTLREHGDEFDDGTSTSSSLTTDTSSSGLVEVSRPISGSQRASTPLGVVGAVEEPEPVIWRRFFQTSSSGQTALQTGAASGVDQTKDKGKNNDLRKTSKALPTFLTWFCGLPKTLTILILCVGLVMFLFFCATVLTIRLLYVRNPSNYQMDFAPLSSGNEAENILLSHRSLNNMGTMLDNTLKIMDEVKHYLESLKLEVKNGLAEAALSTSPANGAAEGTS